RRACLPGTARRAKARRAISAMRRRRAPRPRAHIHWRQIPRAAISRAQVGVSAAERLMGEPALERIAHEVVFVGARKGFYQEFVAARQLRAPLLNLQPFA